MRPVRARQTISSPWRKAMAAPVAPGQGLGAFRNHADRGLQINFSGMNIQFDSADSVHHVWNECESMDRAWLRDGASVANEDRKASFPETDAGTVRSNSRTRRSSSASAIR